MPETTRVFSVIWAATVATPAMTNPNAANEAPKTTDPVADRPWLIRPAATM
jgi:hypothetical protein